MADSPNPPHLADVLARLGDTMHTMSLKLDGILTRLTPVSPSTTNPIPIPSNSITVPATTYKMKLNIPRFDGTKTLCWIFKINQYFEYHNTPEKDCLTIASFYMEGRALAWF